MTCRDKCKYEVSKIISEAISRLYKDIDVDKNIDVYSILERPPESSLGDYAIPCFKLSKLLKQSPVNIAKSICEYIEGIKSEWILSVSTQGAFLNIKINPVTLSSIVLSQAIDKTLFTNFKDNEKKMNVMIEFSQPNTHKEFHIGHLRNLFLGDSFM